MKNTPNHVILSKSLTLFAILITSGISLAATYTVDDNGQADFTSIQAAINAAANNDIIIVSQGRYYENIDFHGKAITVTGTDPNNADVVADTIIDANNNGIVVSFHTNEGPASIITGLTITAGHAKYGAGVCCWDNCSPTISHCIITQNNSADIYDGFGGGLYVSSNASPILTNCIITSNTSNLSGGGICSKGNLTLTNCTINTNTAANSGGGIMVSSGNLTLTNCILTSNTANGLRGGGGGISADGGNINLINCTLASNTANCETGYGGNGGGGIKVEDALTLTLTNCTLSSNTSNSSGGGIVSLVGLTLTDCSLTSNTAKNGGGGIKTFYGTLILNNCTLTSNIAGGGGGISSQGILTLTNCTFTSNTANSSRGGGISAWFGNLTITNCSFDTNTATGSGGGIYYGGDGVITMTNCTAIANIASDGGAIYSTECVNRFRHCTFDNNETISGFGASISCYESNGPAEITHNIITGSKGGVGIYTMYVDGVIDYNNLWNNPGGDYGGWAWPGENDISVDPLFIAPGHWNDNATPGDPDDDFWVDGDYHLHYDSLCINAGDPAFVPAPGEVDMDSQPRIRLGRVDIGADESGSNPADFNENGRVNLLDLSIFAAAWLSEPADPQWNSLCDISTPADDFIDLLDLAACSNQWLWQAHWN